MTPPHTDLAAPYQPPGSSPGAGPDESFRTLLGRLPWPGGAGQAPLRALGVTGCAGGEGVSTVAVRLAAEAALTGREPVLLVDAHLAKPAVHRLLGVKPGPGLAEALREGAPLAEIVQPTRVARLSVLAAGGDRPAGARPQSNGSAAVSAASCGRDARAPANGRAVASLRDFAKVTADSGPLTREPGIAGLLEALKDEFALIVFDLPPADRDHPLADLTTRLDGLVLVVEAERTPRDAVRRAKERLDGRTRLLGAVFNKQPRHTPAWLDRFL